MKILSRNFVYILLLGITTNNIDKDFLYLNKDIQQFCFSSQASNLKNPQFSGKLSLLLRQVEKFSTLGKQSLFLSHGAPKNDPFCVKMNLSVRVAGLWVSTPSGISLFFWCCSLLSVGRLGSCFLSWPNWPFLPV